MGRIFDTLYALWSDETSEYLISSIFSGSKHKQEKNKLFCGYIYFFLSLMEFPLFCLLCQVSQETLCTRDVPLVARRKLGERSASIPFFLYSCIYICVCIICMIVFIFKAIDIFYGYPFWYLFACWEIWENASQWKCGIITDKNVLLMYWA